ncbi:hypothetical protein BGZ96_007679 [Linnemannia gamsii]|uniref:Cytochrome b5 heme-binding domain-containing protein n=1 Tax=Linnemannia gamsii TaxID=64522 RepID=A0ABQ7KEJ9_9FUNG|nr:hypothetical protein BGZ96_007679 [Linnemannia gamsii]
MVNVYTYLESLFKENYTLPIIIATVSIAILIPLYQDHQESKQKKALEEGQKDKKEEANSSAHPSADNTSSESADSKPKAFALPTTPLPPPNLERIFTKEELAQHDGSKGEEGMIYVAIKGIVFDVTAKKAMYGPSGGYHCFAGKDASKALGKSSLKPEDCIADYSELTEKELKTMEDWYTFFEKRYAIVGKTEA